MLALVSGMSYSADEIRYVVQPGDTLIGLGETLLARPADWVVLQRLNGIGDDRRIPIGTQLRIPVRLLRPEPREAEVVELVGQAQANDAPIVPGDRVGAGVTLQTGDSG
ncbi:LysM peptidoglycan-binding domain-containing protein, partial [Arthrospira platensis SPKY2]